MHLVDRFESYVPYFPPSFYGQMESAWNLVDVVAWSALICTVLQYLSGISICITIQQKGGTTDVSAFPFLTALISCSLWLKYGILQKDTTLMTVNSIGVVLQILYTIFYYCHSSNKDLIKKQLLLASAILFPILIYLKYFVVDLLVARSQAGLFACCAGLIFCASPLARLAIVCKTKSAETLPFTLIISTFIMATLWFIYGLLRADYFIQIPNFVGACICAFQLFLFVIFPSTKSEFSLLSKKIDL